MFSQVPVWVPIVFVMLLALGLRQARARTVSVRSLAVLPVVMACFSLYGIVSTFGLAPLSLLAWGIGMAVAILFMARVFAGSAVKPMATNGAVSNEPGSGERIEIPGSWLPLALFMGLFATKFILGFAMAAHAALVGQIGFIIAASIVLGLLSGSFGGRSLGLRRALARA